MLFTYNWIIITFTLIVPALLLCLLQWWLSKRTSPVPGLILPILHLILTSLLLMAFVTYSAAGMTTVSGITAMTGYEQIDTEAIERLQESSGDIQPTPPPVPATPGESASIGIIGGADGPTAIFVSGPTDILSLLPAFLLLNIPTGVYIVIYAVTRCHVRHHRTIDKTTIQDL